MVIAYHLIWTAYGWWLPNDPRGSMSKSIASDIIRDLGDLHYGRKRAQPASRDIRAFYARASEVLKFPLMEISLEDAEVMTSAFAEVIQANNYTCYALVIMPDHVHVLIRKHRHKAEDMIAHLQEASALKLRDAELRINGHPVWGGPGWKVFLEDRNDITRTIRYIEQNPVKFGQPVQRWPFVTQYDGWEPPRVKIARPQR